MYSKEVSVLALKESISFKMPAHKTHDHRSARVSMLIQIVMPVLATEVKTELNCVHTVDKLQLYSPSSTSLHFHTQLCFGVKTK